ncbi:MAG: hypothetical protein J0665_15695 [Deltaproteobacteria bacterium]|jgi:hypothetical protein|nr:hypothetical protein [Deltaproteobacteria bacterium]
MIYSVRNILTSSALLILFSATIAMGASVTFTSSGSGSYLIQGNNMDGVAGIQLDIAYDATSLSSPTVTQGGLVSGAMLAANTSNPGVIKLAIISTTPFSGSGLIATISFASKTGNGGITSVASSMIDSKGSAYAPSNSNFSSEAASAGIITTPGVPFSQPTLQTSSSTPQQNTATARDANTASTTIPTYAGTVTLPTDLQQSTDVLPVAASTVPVNSEEPAASAITRQSKESDKSAPDLKIEETPQADISTGILEQFKRYNGSKNLSAIVTLFDKKIAHTISQVPSILLSNGQSEATLTVDIPTGINSSPNFAVKGGKLVSFKRDKQSMGRWIIAVLPEAGAVRVTVIIITSAEELEFPLTVAPSVKAGVTYDENGWKIFLKEVGTTKAPLHDLNNDGVRDYVDEFIFVANYLANKAGAVKVPKN